MVISYEDARELVRERFAPGWSHGTFCLDDREIIENDEFYAFSVGNREYLVDDDTRYAVPGGVPVVYKEDGRLGYLSAPAMASDPTIRTRPNPKPTLKV